MDPSRNLRSPLLWLGLGLGVLYVPTLVRLATGVWADPEQAHGPVMLAISCWLLWRNRSAVLAAATEPSTAQLLAGWLVLGFGLMLYVVGRSQSIEFIELGSLVFVLSGCLAACVGWRALRACWFPIFFMAFMLPLPGLLVAWFTMPMKIGVSYVAEALLHGLGYPIARTGVIMQIGQYQLLVADACAGLHTLLTLEALGLLYLNLTPHPSIKRNILLALLVVPISFAANVIRVSVIALVTYHLGDDAGQGFLHGFAGMVLFLSALALVLCCDSLLRAVVSPAEPVGAS